MTSVRARRPTRPQRESRSSNSSSERGQSLGVVASLQTAHEHRARLPLSRSCSFGLAAWSGSPFIFEPLNAIDVLPVPQVNAANPLMLSLRSKPPAAFDHLTFSRP